MIPGSEPSVLNNPIPLAAQPCTGRRERKEVKGGSIKRRSLFHYFDMFEYFSP